MKPPTVQTTLVVVMVLQLASLARAADPLVRDQEALMQSERDNMQIWLNNDARANAAWAADEYTYTDDKGFVSDKAADMAILSAGTSTVTTFYAEHMKAMVFGDAGVVVGRATLKGRYEGNDIGGVFRFTSTYIRRDGRWQCVASQMTRVTNP